MKVSQTLEQARDLLDQSWRYDVMPLRTSQLVRREIAPHMDKFGNAGVLIMQYWYVDYALAACRRIAGRGDDEISVQRALTILLDVADNLTAEVLLRHHRSIGNADDDETTPDALQRTIERTVRGARPDVLLSDTTGIGRATVQADLDRFEAVARRAGQLATYRTAHRLTPEKIAAKGGDITVTVEEIDGLLDTVSEIYARWSGVLRRAHVDTSIDHFAPAITLERALRLYDHEAYMDAILSHNRDRDDGPVSLRNIEQYVRPGYVVDED